jgi:DNA-binding GntR family transcriptional regulator
MVQHPSSLYLFVKGEIVDLISKGEFKPGDQLPSEFELAKKLGVSRMTLREALRALEEEGLLARKQGSVPLSGRDRIGSKAFWISIMASVR